MFTDIAQEDQYVIQIGHDISCWKTPGALASLKDITLNWKSLLWHANMAFSHLALSKTTCQYVNFKSRVEKQVALLNRASISSINGNGYAKGLVILFCALKWTQNWFLPTFFSTRTIGKLQDDLKCYITLEGIKSFGKVDK